MPIDNLSKITSRSGINTTILLEAGNVNVTGVVTAASFSGSFSGPVTGGSNIFAGIVTANSNIHVEDFLIHKGDINTKVGFSSAKTFEAISNDSTRFRVTDTDIQILTAAGAHKVGIGRSDLVAKLDVKNNSNIPVLKLYDSHQNKHLTIRGGGSPNRMIIDSYEGDDTSSGAAIDLASGGETKFRVTSDGSVGIGEDTPDSKLDILHSSATNPATENLIHLRTDPGAGYVSRGLFIKIGRDLNYDNSGAYYDIVGSAGNSGFHAFQVQGDDKLRITKDGKVGIGTTTPSAILEITKNAYDTPDNENFYRIKLQNHGGITNDVGIGQAASGSLSFNTTPGGNFTFHNGTNGEIFRITSPNFSGGGVGISTAGANLNPSGNALLIRAGSTVGTDKGHIMLTGDGATTGEGPQIVFSESGSGSNFVGGAIGFRRTGGNGVGDLVFGVRTVSGVATTPPTEIVRITSSKQIGIGSATMLADTKVFLYDTSTTNYRSLAIDSLATNGSTLIYKQKGTQVISIGSGGGNNLSGSDVTHGLIRSEVATVFAVGNSEKVRITNGGEVQIGSAEGGYRLAVTRESSDTTTAETQLLLYSKHDGTGNTGVGYGGGIRFWGDRNSDNVEQNMGRIMCVADVNSGTNISGALVFETGIAGVVNERLRITSGGLVKWDGHTLAERNAATAVAGGLIYNTDGKIFQYYDGSGWISLNTTNQIVATGGNSVATSNGYRIHTFTGAGTFVITSGVGEVEVLVVAGGGSEGGDSSGCHAGGGGGGGGVVYKKMNLSAGNYPISIGQGGSWRNNGGNTVFGNGTDHQITAIGGGAGGPTLTGNGNAGGSGGGGSRHTTTNQGGAAQQPGTTDGGFGNAGGDTGDNTSPGGGGGAGGAGQDGDAGNQGRGGAGKQFTQFGVTTYFGAGGNAGGSYTDEGQTPGSTNGAANTGAGGGGRPGGSTRSSGGSGIVLIRYPAAS